MRLMIGDSMGSLTVESPVSRSSKSAPAGVGPARGEALSESRGFVPSNTSSAAAT
mgnify:CR=1 FL=1